MFYCLGKWETDVKKRKKIRISFLLVEIIFSLYALTLLFPFYYLLLNSLKTNGEFIRNIYSFPKAPQFSNYAQTFIKYNFFYMFVNSTVLTVGGVFGSLLATSVAAYVMARYDFTGKKVIWNIVIAMMLIPGIGTLGATYEIVYRLRLVNQVHGVIIMYSSAFGMNFLLLYSYFKGVARTYAEAAAIDGAGHTRIMFQIMLPQAIAGMFAILVLQFIGIWNDYMTPFLFLPKILTIAVSLQDLTMNATSQGQYVQMFAAMIIALIPVLLIFGIFQKQVMNATMVGGIKG